MQDEKTEKIIEAVKNMTDREADILEVFLAGFRAGKQVSDREAGPEDAQKHSRTAQAAARNPVRSAHSAAGTA